MGMVKIISPHGWDFDGPVAQIIKVGSRGLIGNDRADFVKRASHAFLDVIDTIKAAKDEVPVHVLSHGATEAYGPNRNGDGFSERACRTYHNTFEKYARWYRNHKNKDPKLSYGIIKKSAYNETMRRVELLAFLNAEKSASDRNGGFLADREIEKLAKGEDIPVSMACRVPYDECSYCHHQARTRDDYCTSTMCKAGGCKDNLTRLVKIAGDVHHMHVENSHPTWFDMSHVYRPADRIAYANKADWLQKAASDGWDGLYGESSNKVAEDLGIMAPLAVILDQERTSLGHTPEWLSTQVKLAHGLDRVDRLPASASLPSEFRRGFDPKVQGTVELTLLGDHGTTKCAEGLTALADEFIILPLRDYARLVKKAEYLEPAVVAMKGVYGRMIADGTLDRGLASNPLNKSEKTASAHQQSWAIRLRSTHSLEKTAIDRRCHISALRTHEVPNPKSIFEITKIASDCPEAEALARDYACYQVAALHRMSTFDNDFMLTAMSTIVQNQVV